MHVYFKSITLENVRCFGQKQTVDFTDKDGNASMWNLILGDNGTGKTTVLRGLADFVDDRTNERKYFYRSEKNSKIEFLLLQYFENGQTSQIFKKTSSFAPIRPKPYSDDFEQYQMALFAYGASRQIGHSEISSGQNSPIINLIDESVPLLNAEEWLVQAEYLSLKDKSQPNRFAQAKDLLLRLFKGEISDIKIETNGSNGKKVNVLFKTNFGWVTLHQLSLGYKTLLAWMLDFARGLFERYPDSLNPLAEPAICLVDEIDLHLHPRFQRKIIGFLSGIFPKTQFIVTTHSPLVVQTAADAGANIILLERKGDQVLVNNDPKVVQKWRIDQILTSDLFGLDTTLSPDADKNMERRRNLLRKDTRTEKEENELTELESSFDIVPPEESSLGKQMIEHLKKLETSFPT